MEDLRRCPQLLKTSKPSLGLRFYSEQSLLLTGVVAWGEWGRENWVGQIEWRGWDDRDKSWFPAALYIGLGQEKVKGK